MLLVGFSPWTVIPYSDSVGLIFVTACTYCLFAYVPVYILLAAGAYNVNRICMNLFADLSVKKPDKASSFVNNNFKSIYKS